MKTLNQTATAIALHLYDLMQQSEEKTSLKIDNCEKTFMPVHLELRQVIPNYGQVFSIAHYYEQQGDLMSDPYAELVIKNDGTIHPILFEQHGLPREIYQEVLSYNEDGTVKGYRIKLLNDLTTFCNQWMVNIKRQQRLSVKRPAPTVTLFGVNEKESKAFIKYKGKLQNIEIQEDQEGQHYIMIDTLAIYLKDLRK